MSGGSYDYIYSRIECMADDIPLHSCCDDYVKASLRTAFKKHLRLVAKACRAIEWNDSGDGDQHEIDNIEACLAEDAELHAAIEQAEVVCNELVVAIAEAKALKKGKSK